MVSGGAGCKSLSNCKVYVSSSKLSHLSQGEQKERKIPDYKIILYNVPVLQIWVDGPTTKPQELAVKKFSAIF